MEGFDKVVQEMKEYIVDADKLNNEKIDYDRCSYTWNNLYKKYYSSREFWKETCFNDISNYEIKYGKSECRISGDLLFNFKDKKYNHYKDLLEKESEFNGKLKDKYIGILNSCNKMNYTLHNFGLMPVNGNLQTKKNNCDNDRLDRFIFILNKYYINNDEDIFDSLKSNYRDEEERNIEINKQKDILKNFIDKFGNIYKYCEEMYLISDEKFVKDLASITNSV